MKFALRAALSVSMLTEAALGGAAFAQPGSEPPAPTDAAPVAAPSADTPPVAAPPADTPPAPPEGEASEPTNDDAAAEAAHMDQRGKKQGKKSGSVEYAPREGIAIRAGKASLNFFLGAETVLDWGHCVGDACAASDSLTLHVRRARFAMEAHLPHHLRIDFGIQVKNEVIVLKNANFSWHHHGNMIKAGFLKPPGGLERDSSTWVKPFPERSVVANFKQDRIIGLMGSTWVAHRTVRLQAAAGHPPTGNFDAFEPEDAVVPPAGIEPEDLTSDPGNWDLFATAAYAPSPTFEIGVNGTTHIAPDAGQGPNFSEPYETRIIQPVFFKGAFLAGGGDVSWHSAHLRASAEAVYFHSGKTIPHTDDMGVALEPTRAKRGEAGYAVLGYTPNGSYGPAIENSPLIKGYQFLLRGEFLRVSPGGDGSATSNAAFDSVTGGVEWQVNKLLRLQADVAVQHYNDEVDPSNRNVWRTYSELWGQVLI